MVYLEQVISETLRLCPPLPVVSRAVEEERGVANSPDPDHFDPYRFSAENSVGRQPYSFVPFLGERKMCTGKRYAYMQRKAILSTVLRNYQVLPCGSREEMEKVQFRMSLHIISGFNTKLAAIK
ncbi:hypothetical protein PR048_006964 [Dryococelus australis]|uniref:Cytochrome P450 n=1 Tax=Dryococelus australis TaxID=614101 RepID=A0ABQ9IEL2_9NEOP|nr:hypothetical protein PR048_006964 [Dryococelus australis]